MAWNWPGGLGGCVRSYRAILYTGYGGRLTANEAERMGFAELLAKPFTMQKLGEAVAQALKGDAATVAMGERL